MRRKKAVARFLPGQRLLPFSMGSFVYPQGLEMHRGIPYRTLHRRDFPTGQDFPNLWPWRCNLDFWNINNLPNILFDALIGLNTMSNVGVLNNRILLYRFQTDFLANWARLDWSISIGEPDDVQTYKWKFYTNLEAGYAEITATGYALDRNSDYWNCDAVFPSGVYTLFTSGDYLGVTVGNPWLFRSTYSDWDQIPPDER